MAKYFLLVKIFSRAKGSRVTRAAAYRAGERIRDERTGESYSFSNRKDVVHSEIILPSDLAEQPDLDWARNRSKLWNAAENAGTRRNSRLGREIQVILPPEITPQKRTELARKFAQELAEKYRNAVDLAVHEPRIGGDPRNFHAHLLMTTREVNPKGLGTRTIMDLSGRERRARGLGRANDELLWIRERWAELTNGALQEAGINDRVSHRSYKAQGIDREPAATIPDKVFYAEKKSGRNTAVGDAIRARHHERVEARLKGGDALEQTLRRQEQERRQLISLTLEGKARFPKKIAYGALTRDERNQVFRSRYAAKKDSINQRRREIYRQLVQVDDHTQKSRGEILSEKRRQRYQALSEEQQDYLREERRSRNRNKVAASAAAEPAPATAEESVKNWLSYRQRHSQTATAEDSIKNWLAYRESQQRPNSNVSEDVQKRSGRELDHDASL